ncbi:MAG: S-layer homology domain-containing protein [Bacillota bacterium]
MNRFKKAGLLSLVIVMVMTLFSFGQAFAVNTANGEVKFDDVKEGQWFYENIQSVAQKGIMVGYPNGLFGPKDTFTRAQAVQVLYNYAGAGQVVPATVGAQEAFTDVDYTKWYGPAITWAYETQVTNGVGGDKFAPDRNMTREEMVRFLINFITKYEGITVPTGTSTFDDNAKISKFALEAVAWAQNAEIVEGVGKNNFDPKGLSNRAQVAAVMDRFIAYFEELMSPHVTGVGVVDAHGDGITLVTAPVVGQVLNANIETRLNGVETPIYSYPPNPNANYKWYYQGTDNIVGTEASYSVTSDNVGKVLCVDVSVNGYAGEATWTAAVAVDFPEPQ